MKILELQTNRKLLLLFQYHGRIDGRTRLQKLVFLIEKKYHIDFGYQFIPYFYGPYSKQLQLDIDWLGALEILQIRAEYEHQLTPKGARLLDSLESDTNSEEELKEAVLALKKRSTKDLIREAKSLMQ